MLNSEKIIRAFCRASHQHSFHLHGGYTKHLMNELNIIMSLEGFVTCNANLEKHFLIFVRGIFGCDTF